jgi:regulator of RNase E activity RraA
MEWHSDTELFATMKRELFTAVVGDILDKMGFYHQFLPPQIQPLRDDMVVAGRAFPVLAGDVFGPAKKPFGQMLEALDDMKPNEVYVTTGARRASALWGELMSTRALKLGAVGAVCDGYTRDTSGILRLNYPTFCWGRFAQDSSVRMQVLDYRCRIEIGEIPIRPGDILFGDIDGVLVVPKEAEVECITKALEKARGEKLVKKALEQGMSAVEAFKKYGIM